MAIKYKKTDLRPSRGLVDFVDAQDTPLDAFSDMLGFTCRRGIADTVTGRFDLTSAELRTSKRIRKIGEWDRADGTTILWAVVDGGVWQLKETAGVISIDTTKGKAGLLSYIVVNGTAARAGTAVTLTGSADLTLCVEDGDYFFYDADGPSAGGLVDTAGVAAGVLTLAAYAGSETSGAYTIWRKLNDGRVSVVGAGDRLWFADGVGKLHWYGDDGDGTDIFRTAGMEKPATTPAIAVQAGGSLEAGDYFWQIAFKDARGNVSPAVTVLTQTAVANNYGTLSSLPNAPPWAVEYMCYRTFVDSDIGFHIVTDVYTRLASIAAYVGGSDHTVLTLDATAPALVTDSHIHRILTFDESGNTYIVKDNNATTITVHGDASAETGTAWISIVGGFDITKAQAGTIIDVSSDEALNTDSAAPGGITNTTRSFNEPPPAGLQYLAVFEGDGRMAGYKVGTQTEVWFSGRPPLAPKTGQPEWFGAGEFDYWPHFHDVGPRGDGKEIQGLEEVGRRLIAVKTDSLWDLDTRPFDVAAWRWAPIQGGEKVGTTSPDSITVQKGVMWFLGTNTNHIDIIRFDGATAIGIARGKGVLADVLDSINGDYLDECTGAVFDGFYYMSFPHDANTVNTRTLRFDLLRGLRSPNFDLQPWGCGGMFERKDRTLLCGAPTSVGNIYQVHGSAQDLAADMARYVITGDILPNDVEDESTFSFILVEVVIK